MKAKISKEKNYGSCSQVLARFLNNIVSFYVKTMSKLANQLESRGGPAAVHMSTLPKSFSMSSTRASSSDQDLAELVRIASKRGLAKNVESEFLRQQRSTQGIVKMDVVQRSQSMSMSMERIDEDKACDFGRVDGFRHKRSRSHVVSTDNGMF